MGYDESVGDWRQNFDDGNYDEWYDEEEEYNDEYLEEYDEIDDGNSYGYGYYGYQDPQYDDAETDPSNSKPKGTSTPKDPHKRPRSQSPKDQNKQPKPTHTQPRSVTADPGGKDLVPEEDELCNEKQLDELYAEYESTKPRVLEDVTTDPIPHQLAATLETWMWKRYTSDEIKQVQEKARRPSNATALIPLKMEEEVFHAMSARGKTVDSKYRFIQNALVKGCQPIAMAWSKIIQAVTVLQKYRGDDSPFVTVTPKLSLNLQQIKAELDVGLRLLGMANSQLGFRRRATLKPHLAPGFRCLCDEHNPLTQWMFGGNIKSTIEDTMRINHMMHQAYSGNRGRGRGRGFLGGRSRGRGGYYRGRFTRRGRGSFRGRGGSGNNTQQNHSSGRGRSQRGRAQNN